MTLNQTSPDPLAGFYALCTVIFGTISGVLIGLPVALMQGADISQPTAASLGPMALFGIFGAILGYRKRKSRAFFYLTIITVLLLTSTLATKIG